MAQKDEAIEGKETFTITFCECGENHVGMEQIGEKAENGYSREKLEELHEFFQGM